LSKRQLVPLGVKIAIPGDLASLQGSGESVPRRRCSLARDGPTYSALPLVILDRYGNSYTSPGNTCYQHLSHDQETDNLVPNDL
jgi:hypothetical protein